MRCIAGNDGKSASDDDVSRTSRDEVTSSTHDDEDVRGVGDDDAKTFGDDDDDDVYRYHDNDFDGEYWNRPQSRSGYYPEAHNYHHHGYHEPQYVYQPKREKKKVYVPVFVPEKEKKKSTFNARAL